MEFFRLKKTVEWWPVNALKHTKNIFIVVFELLLQTLFTNNWLNNFEMQAGHAR